MIAGIHQLHYLPWLRYFEKIARSDVFIVLDNIQYNKNGFQNRNRIKTASGIVLLTVPVVDKYAQCLDEVEIDTKPNWRKKHWESIRQSYGKAPFFGEYAEFLAATYAQQWDRLNALNRHLLEYFLRVLGIRTRVLYASDLKVPGVATERLINLMRAAGCSTYYSGAYALDAYLDLPLLEAAGITLKLQQWQTPVYPQRYGPFVSDLSIIDLLMHCGPDSLSVLLGNTSGEHE